MGADHHIDQGMDSTLPQAHDFTWTFEADEGYAGSGAFIVALWGDHITCSVQRDDDLKTVSQRVEYVLEAFANKISDDIVIREGDDIERSIRDALNSAIRSFSH
jgi:hypothetical protein